MKRNAKKMILLLTLFLMLLVFVTPVFANDLTIAGADTGSNTNNPLLCQLTSISVTGIKPAADATQVSIKPVISCTFSEGIDGKTIDSANFYLMDFDGKQLIPAKTSYNASTRTAILVPAAPLQYGTKYSIYITDDVKGASGGSLQEKNWMFITIDKNRMGTPERPLVKVNGQYIDFVESYPLVNDEGRTLIPFRALFEALNASVNYNSDAKKIIADLNGNWIILYIDKTYAYLNDRKVILDTPPISVDGRTYIPLRFAGEALGGTVLWDAARYTVIITMP